jgi:general secretion pathway protein A
MYNEYFGLKESPFSIAPDPRYLYMSEQHREALAHLVYGFNSDGGFVLLTGEVGTGKTTVCRCLLDQIPENTSIAFILNPKLTVEELLATICDEFRIQYPEGNTSVKVFIDLVNAYLLEAHASVRKAILVIDEAQNLSSDVLEQLRLLTNLETNQCKLLQIILLGQPELKEKLAKPELRQLSQRIIARYHLGPLTRKDIGAYISHRLSVAGLRKQLFSDPTISRLYNLTDGVPRLINVICDRALLGTYTQGKDSVSKTLLKEAAREVFGESSTHAKKVPANTGAWIVFTILFLVFGAFFAAAYYKNGPLQTNNIEVNATPAVSEQLISETQEYEKLEWPASQPRGKSNQLAYQSLIKTWNLDYIEEDDFSACEFATQNDLYCEVKKGNLRSLIFLNRPAVLKFYDNNNLSFYGTLTELTDKTATIMLGAEKLTVSIADMESKWFGDYTLLWKAPPHFTRSIFPGRQDMSVPWLKRQLAILNGEPETLSDSTVYTDKYVNQVKEFQAAQGLSADGIVGIQTIIRLNSAAGGDSPKLLNVLEDN